MSLSPDHLDDVAKALVLIEQAQQQMYAACRFLSRVPGLSARCNLAGRHADALKRFWHELEQTDAARLANGASANRLCPMPPRYDC